MATEQKPKTKNGRRKSAKKVEPELLFEDGYWWIVAGTKRINAGRSERYARDMMNQEFPSA